MSKTNSENEKFAVIDNVKCPICKGMINKTWFNFRSGNTVEFIAECWSGMNKSELPRHVFYFQIKVPPCVLIDEEGNIENDEEDATEQENSK